jgi:cob(I)alamin adenosyltransferase
MATPTQPAAGGGTGSPAPRILLFTGDGKGKTTAALGMVLRAAGHGLRTCVIQFIKADAQVGEWLAMPLLPMVEIMQTGLGFLPKTQEGAWARHQDAAAQGWTRATAALADPQVKLIVLDEICVAVARGLLSEETVIAAVRQAQPGCCVVLTGRGATPGLLALADTVTTMQCVKHAYQSGIPAQDGVER